MYKAFRIFTIISLVLGMILITVDGVPAGIMLGAITPIFAILTILSRKYDHRQITNGRSYKISKFFWVGLFLLTFTLILVLYSHNNPDLDFNSGFGFALMAMFFGFISVVFLLGSTFKK